MANIVGAIPVIIYSAILTFIVHKTDNYKNILFKSSLIFIIQSIILSLISDMILTGIILSVIGIILALLLQPMIMRYCK